VFEVKFSSTKAGKSPSFSISENSLILLLERVKTCKDSSFSMLLTDLIEFSSKCRVVITWCW